MQKTQRRLTLFLSAMLAVAITMLTVTPANAAPSRSDGSGNRVIFVHGFAPDGNHDCADYFRSARTHFANKGWRGNLLTFGYYSGNTNCSHNVRGGRDTAIKDVAKAFANYVYNNYSKRNIKVDVVAHSMGGLVVRAALRYTALGAAGFPQGPLYIEDVVTLGTPHGGTTFFCPNTLQQCADMEPGSPFLNNLRSVMPNSGMRGGTDWTTVSSYNDGIVSEHSGIAGIAEHEVQYNDGISHNELRTIRSGRYNSRAKHTARGNTWSSWQERVSPLEQARLSVLFESTM